MFEVADPRRFQSKERVLPQMPSEDDPVDPAVEALPLVDRLPQPTGWRILVMPYEGRSKTKGGLIVPDAVREREAIATVVALVLKIGPLAYKDPDKFGPPDPATGLPVPWCKENQWVCIGRYAGSRFRLEDGEVRIINDDEVVAVIRDPRDIVHV
jgi:co-chaperonin GroES (HSP10)